MTDEYSDNIDNFDEHNEEIDETITEEQNENITEESNEESVESLEKTKDINDISEDDDEDRNYTKEELKELYNLFLLKYKESEILEKLNSMMKSNPKKFKEDALKIGTTTELFQRLHDFYNENINFMKTTLKEGTNLSKDFTFVNDKEEKKTIKDSFLVADSPEGITNVSGEKALTMMFSVNRNIKRIKLINSGFSIDIKSPLLSEINIIYNKISDSIDEYGRMFGTFFYLYADLEIKKILVDFAFSLVINSNLRNWNKKDVLAKNISINDYPAILHAISCLMYKNGYVLKSVCPSCEYVESEVIDLNLLKYHNFDALNEFCLKTISSTSQVKPSTVNEYKKELLLSLVKSVDEVDNKFILNIGKYSLELGVPSIYKHLSYGDEYNAKLTEMVYSEDISKIMQYLKYNYCQMFVPWIKSITCFVDENNTNGIKTEDSSIFPIILDKIQEDENISEIFIKKMVDFISETNATFICYPVNPCPNCHKEVTNTKDGYVFFDAQKNFFIHCAMKLIQNS